MSKIIPWVMAVLLIVITAVYVIEEDRKYVEKRGLLGRYEVINEFKFNDTLMTRGIIYKNRITNDCVLLIGGGRGRALTTINCPK